MAWVKFSRFDRAYKSVLGMYVILGYLKTDVLFVGRKGGSAKIRVTDEKQVRGRAVGVRNLSR
jgi:hypothetical protein